MRQVSAMLRQTRATSRAGACGQHAYLLGRRDRKRDERRPGGEDRGVPRELPLPVAIRALADEAVRDRRAEPERDDFEQSEPGEQSNRVPEL